MPLVPKSLYCEKCKTTMSIVEVKLICGTCNCERSIPIDRLDELNLKWPLCHNEFMDFVRYSRCTSCGNECEEHFPKGRLPLDFLPGAYDSRVFIGGNYESISDLRDIRDAVFKLQAGFIPILPHDDFQIPPYQIYEWDLRLLHNCKYAIFEVTHPGGELFEIARCGDYKVITLLVYQARGFTEAPPRVKTMLLGSGSHEHQSYLNREQLYQVVDKFLRQKDPTQWQRAVSLMGYHFEEYSVYNKIYPNGEAEHSWTIKGPKVDIPNLTVPEITHDFRITSGNIDVNPMKLE